MSRHHVDGQSLFKSRINSNHLDKQLDKLVFDNFKYQTSNQRYMQCFGTNIDPSVILTVIYDLESVFGQNNMPNSNLSAKYLEKYYSLYEDMGAIPYGVFIQLFFDGYRAEMMPNLILCDEGYTTEDNRFSIYIDRSIFLRVVGPERAVYVLELMLLGLILVCLGKISIDAYIARQIQLLFPDDLYPDSKDDGKKGWFQFIVGGIPGVGQFIGIKCKNPVRQMFKELLRIKREREATIIKEYGSIDNYKEFLKRNDSVYSNDRSVIINKNSDIIDKKRTWFSKLKNRKNS
jgi:hypothetical protein